MPIRLLEPKVIRAAGNKPKQIEEYVGAVASGNADLSVARMLSPSGWVEPAQTPEFDEYTVVLRGELSVRTDDGDQLVRAGQAVLVPKGLRVAYATPGPEGAEYIAVCVPAFTPARVHREG